ncbi:hypothetical protein ABEB36_006659 [Hypothenemus hampei]|uniref:SWIM-type domain-containing protein n=1 Tax=Hypothenemus hampei TaxID=57062 RepID=A0ABD1ERA7_HYPHA
MDTNKKMLIKSFIPTKAFNLFKEAESSYKQQGSFSNKILENLYSYFGESFADATELLEKCRIIQYTTTDSLRTVYEVSLTSLEQYLIYDNINYCPCDDFKIQVLELNNNISCKHVLVVYLAKITSNVKVEKLNDELFSDFLNMQLNRLSECGDISV